MLSTPVIRLGVSIMVSNATSNNIAAIAWRSVLVVVEMVAPGENLRHAADKLFHIMWYQVHIACVGFELAVRKHDETSKYENKNILDIPNLVGSILTVFICNFLTQTQNVWSFSLNSAYNFVISDNHDLNITLNLNLTIYCIITIVLNLKNSRLYLYREKLKTCNILWLWAKMSANLVKNCSLCKFCKM